MLELWYRLVDFALPFEWAHYAFMKNALLAVLLSAPLFGLVGTVVVTNRMAFFSDVLGHSALTGIAAGLWLGTGDPLVGMIAFMIVLSVLITLFKTATRASYDTVLGVFFGAVTAAGIVLLSRGGGFAKFTPYLIGDILAVEPSRLYTLAALSSAAALYWFCLANKLVLISVSPVLAFSRRVPALWVQLSFGVLLAVVVGFSVRLVGILMINSLLILPAAAARNLARNVREFTTWSVAISLVCGVAGLLASYYWGAAAGATIVLFAACFYGVSAVYAWVEQRGGRR
ncbi:MAG: metal ABC transporter permease [Candidatus Omnitrophota bacterium]|jgi:zinc transport system permease protein